MCKVWSVKLREFFLGKSTYDFQTICEIWRNKLHRVRPELGLSLLHARDGRRYSTTSTRRCHRSSSNQGRCTMYRIVVCSESAILLTNTQTVSSPQAALLTARCLTRLTLHYKFVILNVNIAPRKEAGLPHVRQRTMTVNNRYRASHLVYNS